MKFTTDNFFEPEHQQPQNWHNLELYLQELGYTFSADPPPRQFVGGFGNLNFLVNIDGKRYVLRRPPLGPLPPGANDMGREYRVTSRLWKEFPLAPKAILFCNDVKILGAPFLIMQYRPGAVIHFELPDFLRGQTWDLSKMVIDVLASFQNVDPKAVELHNFGKPEGFLERAVKGWTKRFYVAAQDVYPNQSYPSSAEILIKWLSQQPVPYTKPTLLHNDFKLNNIVLSANDYLTPVALLDWDMCTRGDPLFDFATLLSYWVEPSDPPALNQVGQMPTSTTPGWMNRNQICDYYTQVSNQDLSDIHYYRVLTAFKHCVIFMQIYARFCRGTTTDPRIAKLGTALDSLFEFTHGLIRGTYF